MSRVTHEGKVLARVPDGQASDRLLSWAVLRSLKRDPQTVEEQRFFAKIEIGDGGCWEWTGSKSDQGYGRFRQNVRPKPAHRVIHDWFYGPEAAAGLDVDHLCRNRACVHPLHLEAVTHAENVRRGLRGQPRPQPTHCKQNHRLVGDNVAPRSDGKGVRCRICSREACRRYAAKRKGQRS